MKATPAQIVESLLDESGPFSPDEVTLEYRPFETDGKWEWFWVLLPADESQALARGSAPDRCHASRSARAKARQMKVRIKAVKVVQPHVREAR